MRTNNILLQKSFMLNEPGDVTSSFGWSRHSGTSSRRVDQCGGPSLFCVSSQCHKAIRLPLISQTPSSLEATWKSILHKIALDPEEYSRGLADYFSCLRMERIESIFASIGETDPWGTVINPSWAAILDKVKETWRTTGSISRPSSPIIPTARSLGLCLVFCS